MSTDYRGKIALVTGAASGIGLSIANKLATDGATVLLVDIDQKGLELRAREIMSRDGSISYYVCDVSDADQVATLHELVTSEHGTPDILVNSAGVAFSGPLEQTPLSEWTWVFGVNLWGIIHIVHYFADDMFRRGSGHIVNMASGAGLIVIPYGSAYTTSKFAAVGFSKVLRAEAAVHNVKVLTVCPSLVRTPMLDNVKSVGMDVVDETSENSGVKRLAIQPESLIESIFKAMEKDRAILVCPLHMKLIYGFSKFVPRLWDRLVNAHARLTYKVMKANR